LDKSLEAIVQENTWIEQELFSPGSVENSIWVSSSPKRDLVTRWAANLEILHTAGIYKEPLDTISTFMGKKLTDAGMQSAIHWMRQNLDYKYKNREMDRGNQWDETASFTEAKDSSIDNYKEANKIYILFLQRTRDELGKVINRLETDTILEPKIPQDELDQFYTLWDHFIKRLREAWDGREKVLSTQQYIMGWCLSNFSLNFAYTKYLEFAKEKFTLTPKQAGKLKRLQVKKVQEVFDPKNFSECVELGFYGQQCSRCGSWRTERRWNGDLHKDQLYCFAEHIKDVSQFTKLKTMKIAQVIL